MPLFSKKTSVDDNDDNDEIAAMTGGIATMQDDVAEAIKTKNTVGEASKESSPAGKKSLRSRFDKKADAKRLQDISRNLADVYTDDDGKIPDLTKLDINTRPLWQTILYTVLTVFAALFIVAAAAFLLYANWNQKSFTNERISFKINPPLNIVAGQDQEYAIVIANNERVTLYNLNVVLQYPENFTFVSSTPAATGDNKNTWDISALAAGQQTEIKFTARFEAAVGSIQPISGILTFKPENLNANFNQKTQTDLGVNASTIQLFLDGPSKVMASDDVQYTIYLSNIGQETAANVEVAAEYPAGFVFASADPQPKAGLNNMWTISELATATPALASSSAKKIVIKGNYTAASNTAEAIMKAYATVKKSGSDVLAAESALATAVVKDELSLVTVINGSAENQGISFGDLLFYTLTFKNNGEDVLKNIEITAHMDSELLDYDTLLDTNKGKVKDGTITWTKDQVAKLKSLQPGEQGEISWQIRVKDLATLNSQSVTQYGVENYSEAIAKNSAGEEVKVKSSVLTASVNSDLSLKAAARYYTADNIAVGSGPIQPTAGQSSAYNISLSLDNNLHSIGNIEVSLTLPTGVAWADKMNHNTGDVSYNSQTRKFIWQISKLPKSTSGTAADFNVTITPSESDVGKVLVLVPEIHLTAKDLETGATIDKTVKAITTSFNDPILGQVSGIVE